MVRSGRVKGKKFKNGRRVVRGSSHKFRSNLADAIRQHRARGAGPEHPLIVRRKRQHPTNPMVRCPECGRKTQADMLVPYQGKYICDADWTQLRREGRLTAEEHDRNIPIPPIETPRGE